jgi:hypothetical protein
MTDLKTRLRVALIVLLAGLGTAGCGDEAVSTGQGLTAELMLTDLKLLLEELAANNRPVPTKMAEMEAYEPIRPSVYVGLLSEEIVYQWGARINSSGTDAILAYEKKAPTDGGWVLMQDGNLKEITVGEFNAAPKAK